MLQKRVEESNFVYVSSINSRYKEEEKDGVSLVRRRMDGKRGDLY